MQFPILLLIGQIFLWSLVDRYFLLVLMGNKQRNFWVTVTIHHFQLNWDENTKRKLWCSNCWLLVEWCSRWSGDVRSAHLEFWTTINHFNNWDNISQLYYYAAWTPVRTAIMCIISNIALFQKCAMTSWVKNDKVFTLVFRISARAMNERNIEFYLRYGGYLKNQWIISKHR